MRTNLSKVGVLLEWNPSPYSRQVQKELEAAASRGGPKLSFVGVEWANASVDDDPSVIDRTLKLTEDFEAMVLISGVFSHGVSGLSRFAQKWAPRPIVSVGYRILGVPSLVVDNRSAVKEATTHLITAHGRKNLLFVRGRRDSHEAEERYLGFRHALRQHRLLFDEQRVVDGEFTRRAAIRAMQQLDRTLDFDGVVAANDDMALAVMTELQRRGLQVPRDVAIIGFDDVPEAESASVPLSTMAQPFSAMAKFALESLKQQANGHKVEASKSVTARLLTRASCCAS